MWICLSAITRRQCEATRFAIIALSFMFLRQLERYLSQSATWKSSKSVKWQEINREISSKCVLNCAVGDALAGDLLAMASNYVSVVFISVCVVVAVALPQNAFLRDGTIFSSESRRVNKRSFSSLIASHRNKSNFPHWEYENPLFQMLKILAPLKKYLLRFLLIKPPRLLRVVFGEEISRFQRIGKFLFDIINWDLQIILDDIEYH